MKYILMLLLLVCTNIKANYIYEIIDEKTPAIRVVNPEPKMRERHYIKKNGTITCTPIDNPDCYTKPTEPGFYLYPSFGLSEKINRRRVNYVLYFKCPPEYPYSYHGELVDPASTTDKALGWSCVTVTNCFQPYELEGTRCVHREKICPKPYSILHDGSCGRPTAGCLSDHEEYIDENNKFSCRKCEFGINEDGTCNYNKVCKASEDFINGECKKKSNNLEGCDASIVNSIECYTDDITNKIDNLDNLPNQLTQKIDEIINLMFESTQKTDENNPTEEEQEAVQNYSEEPVIIPVINYEIPAFVTNLFRSNASCPADNSLNLYANTYSFSYQKICDWLNVLSGIVITLSIYFSYKAIKEI